MAEQQVAELARRLRVPPSELAALDRLTAEQVVVVGQAFDQAAERQRRDLDDALERAIGFIPRLLRGRARRLLFPDSDNG